MTRLLLLLTLLGLGMFGCTDGPAPPDHMAPDAPIEPVPALARLVLSAPTTQLAPGIEVSIRVEAFDTNGIAMASPALAWSSSDPAVADVSPTGEVTTFAAGTARITAHSGTVIGTLELVVREEIPVVARVALAPAGELLLAPGATSQLSVTVYDGHDNVLVGRKVMWSNVNPVVASISPTGLLTAITSGNTTVMVHCEGTIDAITVHVRIPAARLELDAPASLALQPTQTRQLAATVYAADDTVLYDRAVFWSVDAPAIASVTTAGLVTAHADGTATLTASADGLTVQLMISVQTVARIQLSLEEATIDVTEQLALTAQLYDAADQPFQGAVTWSSDHPEIASVDGAGVITGHAEGGALITATSGSVTATMVVHVAPWIEWTLTTVNGADAPATLYAYTFNGDAGEHHLEMRAEDGVLAMRSDGRYELMVFGPVFVDGEESGQATHTSVGSMAWDATLELFQFVPDDIVGGSAFTGRYVAGRFTLHYQPNLLGAPATLGFTR
jgi:uncharacterized protein YjdB